MEHYASTKLEVSTTSLFRKKSVARDGRKGCNA